jgi:hypothetical protein
MARSPLSAFLLIVLWALPASAQQTQQPQEYVLTVTPKDVTVIARAIDGLPFNDETAALIVRLQRQLDTQDAAAAKVSK